MTIRVGASRFSGLVAYLGIEPRQDLLNALSGRTAGSPVHSMEVLS